MTIELTDALKQELGEDVRVAVQKFNSHSWIRYEITGYNVEFEVGDLGKVTGVWGFRTGALVQITIRGLKDKCKNTVMPPKSLSKSDEALARYLGLQAWAIRCYNDEQTAFLVKIDPELFQD